MGQIGAMDEILSISAFATCRAIYTRKYFQNFTKERKKGKNHSKRKEKKYNLFKNK